MEFYQVYYYDCDVKEKGTIILNFVSHQIARRYFSNIQSSKKKLDDINFSFAKLMLAKSLYETKNTTICPEECPSILASYVNAHVEYSDVIKIAPRGRGFPSGVRMWIESGLRAAEISMSLGLPRRARAILRSLLSTTQRLLLPRRAACILTLLARVDLNCEQYDDCRVKIDGIRYIIDEQQNVSSQADRSVPALITDQFGTVEDIKLLHKGKEPPKVPKEFEMVLDVPSDEKYCASQGSPIFLPQPFIMPTFLNHKRSCECYKCTSMMVFNIFLGVVRIEALLHFMSGDRGISGTFYDGGIKMVKFVHNRRKYLYENNRQAFLSKCSADILEKLYNKTTVNMECQFLIDATLLFISENNMTKANLYNSKVFEKMKEYGIDDHFTKQFANEQKLYLLQRNTFANDDKNKLDIDMVDLENDFSAKLMVTPEKNSKIDKYIFKTPNDNRMHVDLIKQLTNSINDTSGPSTRKEKSEFIRPSVKIKLNYDDEAENNPAGLHIVHRDLEILKTPLPKLRSKRPVLVEETAKKSINERQITNGSLTFKSKIVYNGKQSMVSENTKDSDVKKPTETEDDNSFGTSSIKTTKLKVYQNKSRLKRSTSPGKLEQESSKIVVKQNEKNKVKSKVQSEPKTNLTPDDDLVKKYSIRKRK